jgi:hypothetical protein
LLSVAAGRSESRDYGRVRKRVAVVDRKETMGDRNSGK